VWWQRYEKRRNDDFIELMKWIMQLDAKLDEILDRLEYDDGEETDTA
jgi:hypothetical protein